MRIDLLQGEIQMMFDSMPGPQAHLQSGSVRAIGVTGAQRLPMLPEVPTLAEQGLPGIDIHFMFGMVAPAGLPDEPSQAFGVSSNGQHVVGWIGNDAFRWSAPNSVARFGLPSGFPAIAFDVSADGGVAVGGPEEAFV